MSASLANVLAWGLDVLLYPVEGKRGGYYAHCLQLDLVEWGKSLTAAETRLKGVIKAHIEAAVRDDDLYHLWREAPDHFWRRLAISKPRGKPYTVGGGIRVRTYVAGTPTSA